MDAHVLVAEDDRKQAELLRRYFEREGHRVTVVHDGRTAIDEARRLRPGLIVLDGMLPRVDGLDVCRAVRAESPVAILMLTARTTEDDLLDGLAAGADDYLAKPFSPRELVARSNALLRRSRPQTPGDRIRVGPLTIDRTRHTTSIGGRAVVCTPAEFAILATLASRPGRVFSRPILLEAAFGPGHTALDRTVDVHIKNLRRKIETDPAKPQMLLTVFGVGYRLADDLPTAT